MKVSIILGTRPQIIKSAPVYYALRKAKVECEVVNTGQHYDYEMNREFFSELRLPEPATDLEVGKGTPNEQVASIIAGLGRRFSEGTPGVALVPGDTNSALAAGIACSKSGVRVAHLESGCRSNDMRMAEEVNRRVLDHMSQVLLAPTAGCAENLTGEKVAAEVVENVGDTMLDSVLSYSRSLSKVDIAERYGLDPGAYAFMTLHRAETVDDENALRGVMGAVGALGLDVAFSVHPRTKERMKSFGIEASSRLKLLGPLPYLDTLALVKGSSFVLTDSGGLQKEAFWLGRPSLILRDTTEWKEIVDDGAAFVVGTGRAAIKRGHGQLAKVGSRAFRSAEKTFGGGKASGRVAKVLSSYLAE